MDKAHILAVIETQAREVLPDLHEHVFSPTDRLQDLGANSIDRAEIGMLVLERLALQLPRVELVGPRSIGELAELLFRKIHAP
jgi:polyketide biosynthesis acyl carrier protein